jgi:hypothetical protein
MEEWRYSSTSELEGDMCRFTSGENLGADWMEAE